MQTRFCHPNSLRRAAFGARGIQSMKNPFMSMWLSAANRAVGSGAGFWKASARRQQTAALNEANKAVISFWKGTVQKPRKPRKRI
jgi:hypothetical protein